jgi:hypothetical protein
MTQKELAFYLGVPERVDQYGYIGKKVYITKWHKPAGGGLKILIWKFLRGGS